MIASSLSPSHTNSVLWALPVCRMDWELTPPAVQDYIDSLRQQIKQLETQVENLQGHVEKKDRVAG